MAMINTRNSQIHRPEPGVIGVGQKHRELIPANKKLWEIVVLQAKAKFHKWPSPAASRWAHDKYKQLGGRFLDPEEEKKRKKIESYNQKLREKREKKKGKKHHHKDKDDDD